MSDVACPHCESSLIRRRYVTHDYAEIVGLDDNGELVEGQDYQGDPSDEGLECCDCWTLLAQHELVIINTKENNE